MSTATITATRPVPAPARAGALRAFVPLTDRVLAALPGPRLVWVAVWALVPWLNAGANLALDGETSAVWNQEPVLVVLNYAALSLAIAVALWGTRRLAGRVEALERGPGSLDGFARMNSSAGPLVTAAGLAIAFAAGALVHDGWAVAILRGSTWFVLGLALATFLWAYISLHLGLPGLGREHLRATDGPIDPGLRLRPLGGVAFMALWMLVAWLLPALLTALADVAGVVLGLVALGGGILAFAVSVIVLHGQIAEVKAGELAVARDLYARAYAPVRAERTLDALERQHSLLSAADALEKRARAIHDWPIDEGMLARVLTIGTSVVAMAVARLILNPFGL